MSKNELKRQLKVLKSRLPNPEEEIKHVSRILRKKFRKKKGQWKLRLPIRLLQKFLEILRKSFRAERRVKPLFTENDCEKYFKNILSEKNRRKRFTYTSWMKTFKDPITNFNLEPPTYTEITKIISKMKSSTSPCPVDPVSVIAFKKCPILRSHLTKIIQSAWKIRTFPEAWKSGITVLAYKNQKIFVQSHYNLYYQRSLRPLFEIDCINLWKKMSV